MTTLLRPEELWRYCLTKERKRRSLFDIVKIAGYIIAAVVFFGSIFLTFYRG